MIVVTIELHSAITHKITHIGRMVINNIGGTDGLGNYDAWVSHDDFVEAPLSQFKDHTSRVGRVENYPRRFCNVWHLVLRSLRSAFPEDC